MFKLTITKPNGVEMWSFETEQDAQNYLNERSEQYANCTTVIEDVTELENAQKERAEALKYLADTDWYIVREWDNGVPCPEEIKMQRQIARLKI